jgi:hypothetical protein
MWHAGVRTGQQEPVGASGAMVNVAVAVVGPFTTKFVSAMPVPSMTAAVLPSTQFENSPMKFTVRVVPTVALDGLRLTVGVCRYTLSAAVTTSPPVDTERVSWPTHAESGTVTSTSADVALVTVVRVTMAVGHVGLIHRNPTEVVAWDQCVF